MKLGAKGAKGFRCPKTRRQSDRTGH